MVHTYTDTCIHSPIHTYLHKYIHLWIHTYIHTYILHTYIHTYMHTYHIHTYTHTYIHTYVCIHVFTYIHTHAHTYPGCAHRHPHTKRPSHVAISPSPSCHPTSDWPSVVGFVGGAGARQRVAALCLACASRAGASLDIDIHHTHGECSGAVLRGATLALARKP